MNVNEFKPYVADRNNAVPMDSIKDTKRGRRVFLLGNGPPLHDWTMAELKALGADTIGINRSWMASPSRDHKGFQGTTYHVFVSGAHGYSLCDGKVRTGLAICPKSLTWLIDSGECGCGCKYAFVGVLSGGYSPTSFKFDLNRGIMTKFAGYFALQLAAWCGYSEIFLLGYSAHDREGHAFDENPQKGLITRNGMRPWFRGAADWANARGDVRIINCDPESAITCFPRYSKDDVLAQLAAADREEAAL